MRHHLKSVNDRRSYVLLQRYHDRYSDTWSPWEEVTGYDLRAKHGTTPEEWMCACKMWIEVGGRYEYRIAERTDVDIWGISFKSYTPEPACQ